MTAIAAGHQMVNVLVGTNLAKLNTNADVLCILKNEGRRLLDIKSIGWCLSESPVIKTKGSNRDLF